MTDVKPSYYYYMTDNVKLVNKHRVCCFNATASLYVGHAIFYIYFSYFPWQMFVWVCVALFSDQTNMCVVDCFYFGDCFGRAQASSRLSTNCLLPLSFSWTCFSKLLYCIWAYSLFLLINYHQQLRTVINKTTWQTWLHHF
jgi:hypothetical protein